MKQICNKYVSSKKNRGRIYTHKYINIVWILLPSACCILYDRQMCSEARRTAGGKSKESEIQNKNKKAGDPLGYPKQHHEI